MDDETFVVMDDEQIDEIPSMEGKCGKITEVGEPVTYKKSGRMFGFWGRDAHRKESTSIYIMEHFYRKVSEKIRGKYFESIFWSKLEILSS